MISYIDSHTYFFYTKIQQQICCNYSPTHLFYCNPQGNFNFCDLCVARTPLCTDSSNLRPHHFSFFWKENLGKPAALKLIKHMENAWAGCSRVSNPAGVDKKSILTTNSPSLGNKQYWQGKIRSKGIFFCLYFSFYPEMVWRLHRKRNERRKKPGFTFSSLFFVEVTALQFSADSQFFARVTTVWEAGWKLFLGKKAPSLGKSS